MPDECEHYDGSTLAMADPRIESTYPMAKLRPGSATGSPLAQACILGALFGKESSISSFGRFRVLERLGAGGMGVVYGAHDPDLARDVALKLVKVTARNREKSLVEAKALARLSHPNVVPIYDVGIEHEHVYLVMELVRGKTLKQWSQDHKPHEVLAVYLQAGMALAAAHDAGLVHCDFKPENAIVGTDGRVRVVDFGLARSISMRLASEGEPGVTHTGRRAGTLRYMAPEQLAARAFDARCDQFAFAVALWEALHHEHPFIEPGTHRIAPSDLLLRIALGPVKPKPHVASPALECALRRALASDPSKRWPSMLAFLDAVAKERLPRGQRLSLAITAIAIAVTVGYAESRRSPSLTAVSCSERDQIQRIWFPSDGRDVSRTHGANTETSQENAMIKATINTK